MPKTMRETIKLKPETLAILDKAIERKKRLIIWTPKMDLILKEYLGKIDNTQLEEALRIESGRNSFSASALKKRIRELGLSK